MEMFNVGKVKGFAVLFLPVALTIVSCVHDNVVSGVPVEFLEPEKSVFLQADSTFSCELSHSIQCVDLTIVSDSILVLRENIGDGDGRKFFDCYSLADFGWLGDCMLKGRGPGEAINPFIRGMIRSDMNGKECCYVNDVMLGRIYELDLQQSLSQGQTVFRQLQDAPEATVYNYPYRDSLRFIVRIGDEDRMLYEIVSAQNLPCRSFNLYETVSAERCLSQISHCTVMNQRDGIAAMPMLGLPQMNILNLENGRVVSVAVDKAYRRWSETICSYDETSVLYYNYATASDDFIFAAYAGKPIVDFVRDRNVHVHIFDWSGCFLCDATVSENISAMAYDRHRKYLYALDMADNRIYRYDLSGLI